MNTFTFEHDKKSYIVTVAPSGTLISLKWRDGGGDERDLYAVDWRRDKKLQDKVEVVVRALVDLGNKVA